MRSRAAIERVSDASPNLFCFDVWPRGNSGLYSNLTEFNTAFAYYLGMALKFLDVVFTEANFHGEVVWRIEDDATMSISTLAALNSWGVATLGHSVHTGRTRILMYTALVPNFHFIQQEGFADLGRKAELMETPYRLLRPQVFWVGSSTGQHCGYGESCIFTCEELQRFQLVRLSKQAHWLNCSLINLVQPCSKSTTELREEGILTGRVAEDEWMQYRGILDIDGHVDAWGLRWRLNTHSVVFKVKSEYVHHYSHVLKDGVHFIGVEKDMSDLLSKTSIILENDERNLRFLENVSHNARKAMKDITYQNAASEAARALNEFLRPMERYTPGWKSTELLSRK